MALVFLVVFWAAPAASHASHRKKVRFWHMWTAEWKDVVDKVAARFNKSQDEYEVEAISVPNPGADSKFVTGVMGSDPPDVMAQWNPIIPPWADAGLLTPLDELMSPEEKARFDAEAYPVVKQVGTYNGHVYGFAIGINMWALYYLCDPVRKAGLDPNKPPKTLAELDTWGRKLNQLDKSQNLSRIGWLPDELKFFSKLFGGGFYDARAGQVTIDTPRNEAALTYMVNANKALGFDQVIRFRAGINENSFTGGWPFIGGAYGITRDGQWRVEQLRKYAPNLEYRTAPVPPPAGGLPGGGWSNGNFMVVPRGAKEPRGAWEFIKFWSGLMDPDTAAEFYTWGGWLPLTPAVAEAPAYRNYIKKYPQFQTFVDLMPSKNMEVLPPVPWQEFFNDELGKAVDSASRGSITPHEALKELESRVAAEVARRKELGYAR